MQKMSTAHLQLAFVGKTGRDVLPENLPMDILISLARELAYLDEGRLEHSEMHQLKAFLCDLVERLLGMQHVSRLRRFRQNADELLPGLVSELDTTIRDEIVSRLIEHHSRRVGIEEAFEGHFLEESAST